MSSIAQRTIPRSIPDLDHAGEEQLWKELDERRESLAYRAHDTVAAAPMEHAVESLLWLWGDTGEHDLIDVLATFRPDRERAWLVDDVRHLIVLSQAAADEWEVSRARGEVARADYARALTSFVTAGVSS